MSMRESLPFIFRIFNYRFARDYLRLLFSCFDKQLFAFTFTVETQSGANE